MARRGLVECLAGIKDPRVDRTKRHELLDILVITVCAYLSGAENWIEVCQWAEQRETWLRQFLKLTNGIPSHDTFGRVFALIEPKEFEKAFQLWVTALREELQIKGRDFVSVDGKKLRGTFHHLHKFTSAVGIVSAWSSETGLVLGQKRYDYVNGDHEKHASRDLIDLLYLKGCVVTLDAGGATKEICEKVLEKEADFVIGLKGNQAILHTLAKEIYSRFGQNRKKMQRVIVRDKAHGRVEKRTFELIEIEQAHFWRSRSRKTDLPRFAHIKSIGRVVSRRKKGEEKATREVRYYMSSLSVKEHRDFAYAVRSHWKIENQLHWVLDVAFKEDHGRARMKNAGENVAVIRRLALNLLKQDKVTKVGIQAKRKTAGWSTNYLEKVLIGDLN